MTKNNNIGRFFIEELESSGVAISGKDEIIERLEEIQNWQYGFFSIVNNGEKIRLKLQADKSLFEKVKSVLSKYQFNETTINSCVSKICGISKL